MTNSYAYNELLFPPNPFPGDTHDALNGVRYIWDQEKLSWIIDPASTASTDYVNQAVASKVERGGDFLYGQLSFKDNNNVVITDNLSISNTGTIKFLKDRKIECYPGATLKFSYNDTTVFEYDGNGIVTSKPIKTGITLAAAINPLFAGGHFDFIAGTRDNTSYGITLTSNSSCKFVVKSSAGDAMVVPGGNGPVDIIGRSNGDVLRVGKSITSPAFSVDGGNDILTASSSLTNNLINNSNVTDHTLVTKGYINNVFDERVGDVGPGRKIAADNENDAEVGGFWMSGSTLYVKVS